MTLDELKQKWALDCVIDETDLSGAALRTSNLHSQYVNEAIDIRLKLVKIQMDIAKLQVERARYFRGEMTTMELKEKGWDQWMYKTLRADINDMILGSPDMQTLLARQEYLKIIQYFLDSVLSEIKSRSFNIRNAMDFLRWRSGAN